MEWLKEHLTDLLWMDVPFGIAVVCFAAAFSLGLSIPRRKRKRD